MDKKNIKIYQMSKATNLKFQTVKGYYDNLPLTRVDTEILAKFCYVLECKVSDILKYQK